uniref:Uncharacterized protein n=1 Tax=Lepeophtheirus salmonis TaxID=72036 RepID=A0A0K2UDP3_LEPSM
MEGVTCHTLKINNINKKEEDILCTKYGNKNISLPTFRYDR